VQAKRVLARDLLAVPSRSPVKPADAAAGNNSAKQ